MKVIKVSPRGYCYGVVDAMEIARKAARDPSLPRPISIIGMIVHNTFAVEELTALGLHTLEGSDRMALVEKAPLGTVIFTAHGIAPAVKKRAYERGLHVIDATCPDVTRTHALVRALAEQGYHIIYIGKKGHPEPEGVMGEAPGAVTLVETCADLETLPAHVYHATRLAVTTQTTLSVWDVEQVMAEIQRRFPHAQMHTEICRATQLRQEAVVKEAANADLTIVVGDQKSNNANRLAQVAREVAGCPAVRVDSVADLCAEMLANHHMVAITSGASTPSQITRAVIQYVERSGLGE